jgi:RNA polymerase sigma factor (sigma-70 family)
MWLGVTGRSPSDLTERSDAELLALTRDRTDPEAFGEFYRRHQGSLNAFLARRTGDRELAQDLVAETFAIAFSKVDRFDPGRGEGRQWLFGIARIALVARLREGGAERAAQGRLQSSEASDAQQVLEAVEARIDASSSRVAAGLDELSDRERSAVVSRVVEERDYVEIAHDERATEEVVRQRVSRGLRKLARALGRERR